MTSFATGGAVAIFKREVRAYLASPLFYVLQGIVLLVTSVLFIYLVNNFSVMCANPVMAAQAGIDFEKNATQYIVKNVFYMVHYFMLFTMPILSMRLLAEERKAGTLELLVTNPVRDWGLVLGKYFGALGVVAIMLLLTLVYPIAVAVLGGEPEWAVVGSCYVGLLLVAGAYLSFGLFASAITESQVVAAVVGYMGLFLLYVSGGLLGNARDDRMRQIAGAIGIDRHFQGFTGGSVALIDILYFVLFAWFFLFLTAQILGMRRWRM